LVTGQGGRGFLRLSRHFGDEMIRPLLTGRRFAPTRGPECGCAVRLAAVEARLAVVEGRISESPSAKRSKTRSGAVATAPATQAPEPEPPRDERGWPEGFDVEVRKF